MSRLSRRQFLILGGTGAAVGLAGLAGLDRWTDVGPHASVAPIGSAPKRRRRTLVVVELGGGNDGLAMLAPDDGRLRDLRPTLALADGDAGRFAHLAGARFHPALAPLAEIWDEGHLAVVRSVGFEHASRSHFECSQHWWDGTLPGAMSSDGWLGRWLAATMPAGEADPWRAVGLGAGAQALRSERAPSVFVRDARNFGVVTPNGVDAEELVRALAGSASSPGVPGDVVVASSRAAMRDALSAVEHLGPAFESPIAAKVVDAGAGRLTASLTLAADLIVRGLGVEVITTGVTGFDTHADQAATHQALLDDLATGLSRFWHTVRDAGSSDDVLVMTTSEFGRRVAENGSIGTDHGLAGCQLVLGGAVRQGVIGEVDLTNLVEGDLRPTIDPRSLYAEALDWLGGPTAEVLSGYEDLGLVS